jgi:hypothetical protein
MFETNDIFKVGGVIGIVCVGYYLIRSHVAMQNDYLINLFENKTCMSNATIPYNFTSDITMDPCTVVNPCCRGYSCDASPYYTCKTVYYGLPSSSSSSSSSHCFYTGLKCVTEEEYMDLRWYYPIVRVLGIGCGCIALYVFYQVHVNKRTAQTLFCHKSSNGDGNDNGNSNGGITRYGRGSGDGNYDVHEKSVLLNR